MTEKLSPWQEYAGKALELAGVSQSELARRLSAKLDTIVTQGSIQSRLRNPSSLPPDGKELQAWADAMRLEGFHRSQFVRLALLARTPEPIAKELLAVEARLERANARLAKVEKESDDLRDLVASLRRDLAQTAAQAAQLLS